MTSEKRPLAKKKKSVTFSDYDTVITPSISNNHAHKKRFLFSGFRRSARKDHDGSHQPVSMRKSLTTVPVHLLFLLYYYMKTFDIIKLYYMAIPSQIFYLMFQFRKNTVYGGKKLMKTNYSLLLSSFVLALPVLSLATTIIFVLCGAPLLSMDYLVKTIQLSFHCCILAFPAIYTIFNCNFKVAIFKKYFIAIMFGCWLSCIVIPLDWDRDWQEWPIPLVIGAYSGAFVGYTIGAYI
ncbi:hypothetical protein ACO0RG_000775 [Hanseniaspora osmophila]|uniref:Glycosylphosphatidylinositol anchor biosynthesis protein 11 n=1 Tax=Hanseniaspora osmophila TaxID=56408 RepID=A0A1E5R1P7_9ASCO|nr:Glycosylphosphatidylinositol anchor biosynthesis protein 11 [Hanseniaspora osmophila]